MAIQNTSPTPEAEFLKQEVVPEQQIAETAEQAPVKVEIAPEQSVEKPTPEQAAEQAPVSAAPTQTAPAQPTAVSQPKSEDLIQIETILAEGLADLYKELPDNRKPEFKQKGEETAREVEGLLHAAKVKMHKVVRVIVEWLKMIPGVNKFFLEQESKIKADRLLEYKNQKQKPEIK